MLIDPMLVSLERRRKTLRKNRSPDLSTVFSPKIRNISNLSLKVNLVCLERRINGLLAKVAFTSNSTRLSWNTASYQEYYRHLLTHTFASSLSSFCTQLGRQTFVHSASMT